MISTTSLSRSSLLNHRLTRENRDAITHRYMHGPAVDQILADEQYDPTLSAAPGDVLWPLTDHQGTVRDLASYDVVLDQTDIVNHIEYDSFGNITAESDDTVDHAFGFTGRSWDDDVDLYYYRARWYDPAVGRFISEDPAGFAAGDANLYRYVTNSPVNFTDPSGLQGSSTPRLVTPNPFAGRNDSLAAAAILLRNAALGSPSQGNTGLSQQTTFAGLSNVSFTDYPTVNILDDLLRPFDNLLNGPNPVALDASPAVPVVFGGSRKEFIAAESARIDANFERFLRSKAGPVGTFLGATFLGVERLEGRALGGVFEVGNIGEDILNGLVVERFTGLQPTRSQTFRALEGGQGFVDNVAASSLGFVKGVVQFEFFSSAAAFANDPSLANGRRLQDAGADAAVALAGARIGTKINGRSSVAASRVVDKSYKLKIQGTAQKTGTPGHQFRTYREAIAEAKKPNVQRVHLNQGYNRGLDLDPKTITPNRRPDVLSVYDDASIRRIEVQSRTDVNRILVERNSALDIQIRAQGFNPSPPRVVRPTKQ